MARDRLVNVVLLERDPSDGIWFGVMDAPEDADHGEPIHLPQDPVDVKAAAQMAWAVLSNTLCVDVTEWHVVNGETGELMPRRKGWSLGRLVE